MARPVVGVISNAHMLEGQYLVHAAGALNVEALSRVANVLPVIIPTNPEHLDVEELIDSCDGFFFPGGRPNVHPEEYGEAPTEAHGTFNRDRDRISLPLIRQSVARGVPIFGVCLGFQEFNVAMGGTLYPEIRDLPGRDNHRMPPDGTLEEKFALRHEVTLTEDGPFHRLFGSHKVMTNTLHGQGIKTAGPRVVIDGHAPDGTPEAIYIQDAPGFAMAVQWHPEWNAAGDPVSRPMFEAFGQACCDWRGGALRKIA
ncbi:gamma-glutamyl-gamma-aminobutyrate hydrolase family protein [Yoonia litorea]|uniref:gamma-glutamyl-gamma-aminobutyrate hydrolase n=1 Tax=Yoonia litorea TaxID=1123755 RepID=A0A1I6MFA7_9RHOB|nr:gamma-glutamyl-gamma-aminobutyrate hydrolase family protein [Yoonia litorea]SFS14267.1 putative glutamine amidotransferase [Yoonia litorea]